MVNKLKLNDKFREYSIEQPNIIKYTERFIFIMIIGMFLKHIHQIIHPDILILNRVKYIERFIIIIVFIIIIRTFKF